MTKSSAGLNSTCTATCPNQGLTIDFSFSGVQSKDKKGRKHLLGFNGKSSWILFSDHSPCTLHGTPCLSKACPVEWLCQLLTTYSPYCKDEYVVLDQGGELYGSPDVRNHFSDFDYDI